MKSRFVVLVGGVIAALLLIGNTTTAQTLVGSRAYRGLHDFTVALLRIPHSNTLPGSCNAGEVYHDDNATPGSNLYTCIDSEWVLQAGGGSGAPTNAGYLTNPHISPEPSGGAPSACQGRWAAVCRRSEGV